MLEMSDAVVPVHPAATVVLVRDSPRGLRPAGLRHVTRAGQHHQDQYQQGKACAQAIYKVTIGGHFRPVTGADFLAATICHVEI